MQTQTLTIRNRHGIDCPVRRAEVLGNGLIRVDYAGSGTVEMFRFPGDTYGMTYREAPASLVERVSA